MGSWKRIFRGNLPTPGAKVTLSKESGSVIDRGEKTENPLRGLNFRKLLWKSQKKVGVTKGKKRFAGDGKRSLKKSLYQYVPGKNGPAEGTRGEKKKLKTFFQS